MLAYQLYTLPTQSTLDRLKQVFEDCPFEIDWSLCSVELNMTIDSRITEQEDPLVEFVAQPISGSASSVVQSLTYQYDVLTEMTNLYLPLSSNKMYQAAYNSRAEYQPLYHTMPLLYMIMKYDYRYYRPYNNFVNSISDYFYRYPEDLVFKGQYVRAIDAIAPNDKDFYQSRGLE